MKFLKVFGVNLLSIAAVTVLIFWGISMILSGYTRHGESLTVPDIKGLPLDKAEQLLSEKKLRYIITDSMYFDDKPRNSVLEQNPAPQSKVKEGRFIYITINSHAAPPVNMPNLLDVSLRQAEAMLASVGLKPGKLEYRPDIAKDVVLDIRYNGRSIQPNTKVPKGSVIDMVLGDGLGGEEVSLPDLSGLTLEEARNLLSSTALSVGSVVYQGTISDSASAKVFRQNPAYTDGASVSSGQPVDLFLKQE